MELMEREEFLALMHSRFEQVSKGEGHCLFVSGEAGIGKTSLINTFCREIKSRASVYQGTCDALFTPRPLAPLYDILMQLPKSDELHTGHITDRTAFFTNFFYALQHRDEDCVVVFEDIHWADEATLDFIKFFGRRITRIRCLFILTFRDDDIHSRHPLRNVLGQLTPDSFTRIQLPPFSKQVVQKLAGEKGYNAEEVYSISAGNPFYVNEILASYSTGVPAKIKDSILSVYNRLDEKTKHIWEVLSVLPTAFEVSYLEKLEPQYITAIENCIETKILILEDGKIFFKHELYRRTIESALSPLLRINLNKQILGLLMENFEKDQKIEQIIHHAKNSNDYELVVQYAPVAAKKAACVGSHIEAARLYYSAIENYQGNDTDLLIEFYESYAYECYLTNQVKEAIIYTKKNLNLWKKKEDIEKTGNCMRFLSRLWWFDGNRKQAESFAVAAVEVLENQPPSSAKAMAYSNMSQLKMLSDQPEECISWGEKAIAMARELGDDEILSHALNNVGDVQSRIQITNQQGIRLLQQSLEIALKNSYHEHVARAYTNLGHNGLLTKDYAFARQALDEGIKYCEERDLNSWTLYMLSSKARMKLETGKWGEAFAIADDLLKEITQAPVARITALVVIATIRMRRGDTDILPLLNEAKLIAFETLELQRIIPALVALLEYEWITGNKVIDQESLDKAITMVGRMGNIFENSEFAFWLQKARNQVLPALELFYGYETGNERVISKAAAFWEQAGNLYQQGIILSAGNEEDRKRAIKIVHQLGAETIYEKMKLEMRSSGIRSIPRGIRKSTQSNPAMLTGREIDVLQLLQEGLQNKEIAARLFISAKTVDHHISAIFFKLDVNSRVKAVQEADRLGITK